jgi:hypothetical protein
VLIGHNLTYHLVGEPGNGLHDYLRHAPQLIAILATVGLLGLAVDQRAARVGTARFGLLGMLVFGLQEHVERVLHTGELPFILADRTFILGVALQIPIGLLCVVVARVLTRELHAPALRRIRVLPRYSVPLSPDAFDPVRRIVLIAVRGRGPPSSLGSV